MPAPSTPSSVLARLAVREPVDSAGRPGAPAIDDYYDYHARLSLSEPLAIAGFLGAGVRAIANSLAARTGLPLVDLPRLVEARAGSTRARLVLEEGLPELRRLEERELARAVLLRPPPLIALGDGAWLSAPARELLRHDCTLVYVRRPTAWLLERVRDACERQPGSVVEYLVGPPETLPPFEALLAEREPAYLEAPVHFDAETLHPHRIAEALRDLLPTA